MEIHFNKYIPEPLKNQVADEHSIWGNTFTLKTGEKVLLNAESGKGKTTFTHTLAGIRKDYDGEILFDKRTVNSFTAEEWAEIRQKQLSFIYQDLQLFDQLTVEENLEIKNNLTYTFEEKEIKEMLEVLEIDNKWNQPCGNLSMGQKQRVAIVRALCQPYEWIIMDEPFSHLDSNNADRAMRLIETRSEKLNAGYILTSLGNHKSSDFDKELIL